MQSADQVQGESWCQPSVAAKILEAAYESIWQMCSAKLTQYFRTQVKYWQLLDIYFYKMFYLNSDKQSVILLIYVLERYFCSVFVDKISSFYSEKIGKMYFHKVLEYLHMLVRKVL